MAFCFLSEAKLLEIAKISKRKRYEIVWNMRQKGKGKGKGKRKKDYFIMCTSKKWYFSLSMDIWPIRKSQRKWNKEVSKVNVLMETHAIRKAYEIFFFIKLRKTKKDLSFLNEYKVTNLITLSSPKNATLYSIQLPA